MVSDINLNAKVDKRKGDRHKSDRQRTPSKSNSKPKSRWDDRHIIAWDGEAATRYLTGIKGFGEVRGTHVYNLLANSENRYLHNDDGIPTKQCLDFMLAVNPKQAIHVIFSGGYDVNMILRDLPKHKLEDLWNYGRCHWEGYRLTYKARKVFTVAREDPFVKTGYSRSFVLWDVFGFYQSSFVKACRKWLIDTDTINMIDEMKQRRSEFTAQEFDDILKYCMQECGLLVLLVQELFKALDKAGLRLSRFDGAGAIAGAMLRQNNIKDHIPHPSKDMYDLVQRSYAGGRIEAVRVGNHEGPVWKYDINSAYPSAALALPSMQNVTWVREPRPSPDAVASLVAVEFSYEDEAPFYPLFFRSHDGTILFPRTGAGVYWHHEFNSLQSRYTEGVDYEVLYAINLYSETPDLRPLSWLSEAYETRLAFKREGNMAQEAIKLGINSVYGKMAQQEGYIAATGGRDERYPTYHCLAWAALITSRTRSLMYDTAIRSPSESVIAFATDAVIGTSPIGGVPVGTGLGEWTVETYEGCTLVQAGVYWLKDEETGEWFSKYRGFDSDSLQRDAVVEAWNNDRTQLPVTLTRFVGMGSALNRKNFADIWRTWHRENRTLDLQPKGKRLPLETDYADKMCATRVLPNMDDGTSYPYPVAWMGQKKQIVMDGETPVHILEQEYEEGYL